MEDEGDDENAPSPMVDGVRYVPRRRVVHLDLKGAPPTVEYFKVRKRGIFRQFTVGIIVCTMLGYTAM